MITAHVNSSLFRRYALLTVALSVAWTLQALPGSAQQKRAVVVGINTYAPTETGSGFALRKWKDLAGAVHDAEAMAALLEARFGFDEIVLLTEQDATRDAILSALDELERSGGRYGLITMCAAGGMAPAVIIERT